VQTQPTTTPETRHCSRCDSDLPLSAFGSHAYCRACYRKYMDAWKANRNTSPKTRRAQARLALREGRCVICGANNEVTGQLCQWCDTGLTYLGDLDLDFEDHLLNALDYYNGVFSKSS
jgi:hypothetical protein